MAPRQALDVLIRDFKYADDSMSSSTGVSINPITLLEDLQVLGVAFVSFAEASGRADPIARVWFASVG